MLAALHLFCSLFAIQLLYTSPTAADRHYQAQIRCIGDPPYGFTRYPGQFPLQVGLSGPFSTARSICAKAIYGGNTFTNAGAFCHWEASPPTIVFETNIISRAGRDISYGLFAFCINRCRCLKNLSSEAISEGTIPAGEILAYEFEYDTRYSTGIRPYDVNPPRSTFWLNSLLLLPGFINTMDIFFAREDNLGLDSTHVLHMAVPISRGPKAPRCNGDLPRWGDTFPTPFRIDMFSTLKQLCAVSYFGGSPKGNAGLQCSIHDQLEVMEEFVHPSFVVSDSHLGLAVQAYCRSICRCGDQPDPTSPQYPPAVYLNDWPGLDVLVTFPNEGVLVHMKSKTNPSVTTAAWTSVVVPGHVSSARHGNQDPTVAAFCGESGCRFTTNTAWIEHRGISRLPGNPEFTAVRDTTSQSSTCGGKCTNFQDCADDVTIPCRCKVHPEAHELLKSGFNPRYLSPVAVCLGATFMAAGLSFKSRLGLKRRDLDLSDGCPCNSTYVSYACCESPNGIVWEPLEQKLGEL